MITKISSWNLGLYCIVAFSMSPSVSAAVILDEMNDDSNFSSEVNLALTTGLGVAVFQPSATLVEAASIVWSDGGNNFSLASGQVLSFMFSAYQAGTASSFTNLSFTAVYNNPLMTEILLGTDHLIQYVVSGDTGNYAIPVVAEATGWYLRMDFEIQADSASGTLGTVDLDYLQVIPEPSSLMLVGSCLPFFFRRRR